MGATRQSDGRPAPAARDLFVVEEERNKNTAEVGERTNKQVGKERNEHTNNKGTCERTKESNKRTHDLKVIKGALEQTDESKISELCVKRKKIMFCTTFL